MIIIGAGLAGLIAGHMFPRCKIIERSAAPAALHQALLRFRSDEVARVTGLEFRPVTVHKGIYHKGEFRQPTIELCNLYSRKVAGRLLNRSIWAQEAVQRWIAPGDLYQRLVEAMAHRIEFGHAVSIDDLSLWNASDEVISTMPMPELLKLIEQDDPMAPKDLEFARAPIHVTRLGVPGADVYQTVYFPDPELGVYRASMTGSVLIVESMRGAESSAALAEAVLPAFGIDQVDYLGDVEQRYGKIAPVDDRLRRELINQMTIKHGIFSVGRFATWRNILLDDVVKDLRCVRRMIDQGDAYGERLTRTKIE